MITSDCVFSFQKELLWAGKITRQLRWLDHSLVNYESWTNGQEPSLLTNQPMCVKFVTNGNDGSMEPRDCSEDSLPLCQMNTSKFQSLFNLEIL